MTPLFCLWWGQFTGALVGFSQLLVPEVTVQSSDVMALFLHFLDWPNIFGSCDFPPPAKPCECFWQATALVLPVHLYLKLWLLTVRVICNATVQVANELTWFWWSTLVTGDYLDAGFLHDSKCSKRNVDCSRRLHESICAQTFSPIWCQTSWSLQVRCTVDTQFPPVIIIKNVHRRPWMCVLFVTLRVISGL